MAPSAPLRVVVHMHGNYSSLIKAVFPYGAQKIFRSLVGMKETLFSSPYNVGFVRNGRGRSDLCSARSEIRVARGTAE